MLTVAILALFGSSCSSDDEEKLGPFVEYSKAQSFYDTYKSYSTGEKFLIDTRSADLYKAGHLEGAINLPATVYNTSSDDAQWCVDLKNLTKTTNVCLFFYGPKTFQDAKIVAGRASRLGYGKENSRIYSKGYDDDLKSVWK